MFVSLVLLMIFLLTIIFSWCCKGNSPNLNRRKLRSECLSGIVFCAYGKVFHQAIGSMVEKYGDIFSFGIFFRRIIIVSRIDYIEEILSKRQIYEVSDISIRNFRLLFPNGLLSLKGERWKRHARVMLPVFRRNNILAHFETIVNCIDEFIDQQFLKNDRIIHQNLVKECQNVLLRVIARIAFNSDVSNLSTLDGENIHQALNEIVHCGSRFSLMIAMPFCLAKLRLKFNRRFQRALRIIKDYVRMIINDEQQRKDEDEFDSFERKKTLIRSLIESAENEKYFLHENEIFDEISISILAGFETTSTALSWFIYYMSKYPHIQQKIKEEFKQHGLTLNSALTNEVLDQFIYLDCIVKELLRFAPIAAGIVRRATINDIIDGIQINKGDLILIAIQNLHQNSNYWKINPKLFCPERFLHQDKDPPKYAYLPFGGGHRKCIGQDLAILELKIAITRLMQRVTFEDPGHEQDNSGGFIQRVTCFPKHMAVRVTMDSFNYDNI